MSRTFVVCSVCAILWFETFISSSSFTLSISGTPAIVADSVQLCYGILLHQRWWRSRLLIRRPDGLFAQCGEELTLPLSSTVVWFSPYLHFNLHVTLFTGFDQRIGGGDPFNKVPNV